MNEKTLQAGEGPETELVLYPFVKTRASFHRLFRVCALVYFCLSGLCVCVVCN